MSSRMVAKRKREAYVRFQAEQTGVDPSQVPVVHSGGQSRPLGTTPLWEPESAQSDSAEQIVVPDSDARSASRDTGDDSDTPSRSGLSSYISYCSLASFQKRNDWNNS